MRFAITGLVAVHLLVTMWHGQAHASLGIALSPGQNAFVAAVIVIAPIVAGLLVWT